MRIDILTLFPEMFDAVLGSSILRRAAERVPDPAAPDDPARARLPAVSYHLHNIREHTDDKHHKVDAPPFGGGPGMVLRCQPVWDAAEHAEAQAPDLQPTRIALTPTGRPLTQPLVERLARRRRLLLLAGHYEGFDQRVLDRLHERPAPPEAQREPIGPAEAAEQVEDGLIELSLGDYVLSGGELPAMVLIDAVVRLLPGVLGHADSAEHDSFSAGTSRLLDCPHYTRPRSWDGRETPAVLLSGDHAKIEAWRAERSRELTLARRPELVTGDGGASSGGSRSLLVTLRDAERADAAAIAAVHRAAFPTGAEAQLVAALDKGGHSMISVVAEHAGRVVGHVLLSEMTHAEQPGARGALGLGPIAVEPAMQGRGIGTALVREAIRQAKSARVGVIFVLGDARWYARLGFEPASVHGWASAYRDAGDAFAALPLRADALPPGLLRHAPPFAILPGDTGEAQANRAG